MMKNKILSGCLFLVALLIGCFEDEGNYDYKSFNRPVWDFNYLNSAINVDAYTGDSTKATPPMHFEGDSSNFRFEWRTIDGRLFCEERVLAIPTDTLFARLGITSYKEIPQSGTLAIIDQSTGMRFVARLYMTGYGIYTKNNVLILSENGNNAKLSYYSKKTETVDGVNKTVYSLKENIFDEANPGMTLEGIPRGLYANKDKAISSSPLGATTIVTSRGTYVVNNEDMVLAEDLKDEFMSGTPDDYFNVVSAFHREQISLLATADGKLYRRVKTDNFLGGKFLSEPYIVDEKEYQVKGFGLGCTSSKYLSPCWDEKNRRILMINMKKPFNILPLTYAEGAEYPDPVWAMPEGTEMLHVFTNFGNLSTQVKHSLIYNDKSGKTWLTDFMVANTGKLLQHRDNIKREFPGGNLPKGTKFLTSASMFGNIPKNYIFYSMGNEIHYVSRENYMSGKLNVSPFVANIVAFIYGTNDIKYDRLYVALENGDFFEIDISNIVTPKIIEESKFNVGGKIVDLLEIATNTYQDFYK